MNLKEIILVSSLLLAPFTSAFAEVSIIKTPDMTAISGSLVNKSEPTTTSNEGAKPFGFVKKFLRNNIATITITSTSAVLMSALGVQAATLNGTSYQGTSNTTGPEIVLDTTKTSLMSEFVRDFMSGFYGTLDRDYFEQSGSNMLQQGYVRWGEEYAGAEQVLNNYFSEIAPKIEGYQFDGLNLEVTSANPIGSNLFNIAGELGEGGRLDLLSDFHLDIAYRAGRDIEKITGEFDRVFAALGVDTPNPLFPVEFQELVLGEHLDIGIYMDSINNSNYIYQSLTGGSFEDLYDILGAFNQEIAHSSTVLSEQIQLNIEYGTPGDNDEKIKEIPEPSLGKALATIFGITIISKVAGGKLKTKKIEQ